MEMAERGGELEEVVIFPPGKEGLARLNVANFNSNECGHELLK